MSARLESTHMDPEDGHPVPASPAGTRHRPAPLRGADSWWQLTLAGALALIIALGTLQLIPYIAHPVALLILAICIAAATAPFVSWLQQWMPRLAAIIVVYVIVLAFFAAIFQVTIPALVTQAQKLGNSAPTLINEAQGRLDGVGLGGPGLQNALTNSVGQLSSALVALPLMLFSAILEVFTVLVMSIYWLIVAYDLRDFFLSLFPQGSHAPIRTALQDIGSAMGGYIRATVINGLVIGTLVTAGLMVMGVEFPLVLGLLSGILELVPIIGPIISGVLVIGVALTQSPTLALVVFIYMFLLQQLEGNVLVPNVMRSQTDISPLLVILALFIGNTIGGLLGALIAIPIASAIQVVTIRFVVPAIRRRTGVVTVE